MSVKIRLSRGGSKKRPFYSIVAANSRDPRDGRFLEKIGTYNPMLPKEHAERLVVKQERAKYWLSVGAQPTDRVARMFGDLGLVEKPAVPNNPHKAAPGKKAQDRLEARQKKAAEAAEAAAAPAPQPEPVAEVVETPAEAEAAPEAAAE